MHVKPRGDLKVWDPDKRAYLLPEGREVPDGDLYWNRILADGDVELVELPIGSGKNAKRSSSADAGESK